MDAKHFLETCRYCLCVTREEFARLWKSSLRENTPQALGWAHFLESPNSLYKKWKSPLPKLCQEMLENFVGTRSHVPCWSHQEIINIKKNIFFERKIVLPLSPSSPCSPLSLTLSAKLTRLLCVCVFVCVKPAESSTDTWETAPAWAAASVSHRCVGFLPVHETDTFLFALCLESGVLFWFQGLENTK